MRWIRRCRCYNGKGALARLPGDGVVQGRDPAGIQHRTARYRANLGKNNWEKHITRLRSAMAKSCSSSNKCFAKSPELLAQFHGIFGFSHGFPMRCRGCCCSAHNSSPHLSARHGAVSGLIDSFCLILSLLHAQSCSRFSCAGHRRAIQAWAIN